MKANDALADLKPLITEALMASPLTKEELIRRVDPDLARWVPRALHNLAYEKKTACTIKGVWYLFDGPGPNYEPPPETPQEAPGEAQPETAPVVQRRRVNTSEALSRRGHGQIQEEAVTFAPGSVWTNPPGSAVQLTMRNAHFPITLYLHLTIAEPADQELAERLIEAVLGLEQLGRRAPRGAVKVRRGTGKRPVYDHQAIQAAVKEALRELRNAPWPPRLLARHLTEKGFQLGAHPAEVVSRLLKRSKDFERVRGKGGGWRLKE